MKTALFVAVVGLALVADAKSHSVNVPAGTVREMTESERSLFAAGDTLIKTGGGELIVRTPLRAALGAVEVRAGRLRFDDAFRRTGLAAMWSFDDPEDIGYDIAPAHSLPVEVQADSTDWPTLVEDGVSGRALHFGNSSMKTGGMLFRRSDASPRGVTPSGNAAFTFSFWMRPTAGACGRGPNFLRIGKMTGSRDSMPWDTSSFYFGSVQNGFSKSFEALCFYCCPNWTRDGEIGNTNNVALAVFRNSDYLMDGRWHHVVGTYANRRMRIYVDGEMMDERRRTSDVKIGSDPAASIGLWGTNGDVNHKYAGDLDEIQWLAGEWSPETVKAEYENRRPRRESGARPCDTIDGAAVTVAAGAALALDGSASWRFASVTGAGDLQVRGGSTLAVGQYRDYTGKRYGAGLPVFAFDVAQTAERAQLTSTSAAVVLPTVGRIVFANAMGEIPATRRFLLAEGPSFVLPENFTGWTFEPADRARRLNFEVEGGRLYVSLARPRFVQLFCGGAVMLEGLGRIRPEYWATWDGGSVEGAGWAYDDAYTGTFTLAEKTDHRIDGTVKVSEVGGQKVRLCWRMTPTVNIPKKASLDLTLQVNGPDYYGGKGVMSSVTNTLPLTYNGQSAYQWSQSNPTQLTLFDNKGVKRFTMSNFSPNVSVLVQDNRQWNMDNFSVRIATLAPELKVGEYYELAFDFTTPQGCGALAGGLDVVATGPDYAPLKSSFGWIRPGSALDFSALRGTDAPAGRHGRVVRKGAHFEFADRPGVPQRFYGVNLVGEANVPDKAKVGRFAANLARLGYNAVRFHHHETPVCDAADDSQTTLDAVKMDRFDALVAALVENGIYLTTDVYVSRYPTFRSVGIDRDGKMGMGDTKILLPVHEGMYRNLEAFTRAFLGHVNPYTGRSLAQEPALVGLSLINEPSNYLKPSTYMEMEAWRTAWEKWLAEKKRTEPTTYANVTATAPDSFSTAVQGPAFMRFLMDTEIAFANRMRRFLRDELGCRAPLTSMNNCFVASGSVLYGSSASGIGNPAFETLARAEAYDFTAFNGYWDHPSFLGTKWSLPIKQSNQNPLTTANMGFLSQMRYRHVDMPFTVTEFNNCAPMGYRIVGGLMVGAMGALQDWDGMWRFAWSHDATGVNDPESKGYTWFDVSGDPANLASERALVPLFLRRDLPPIRRTYAVPLKPADYAGLTSKLGLTAGGLGYDWAGWYAKVGFAVGDSLPAAGQAAPDFAAACAHTRESVMRDLGLGYDAAGRMPVAGDGRVTVDPAAQRLLVNSGRTVGGFAPSGTLEVGPLAVDLGGVQAAVWVTSLDGGTVPFARRLLLTHLTDMQNSHTTFADGSRAVTLSLGGHPFLAKTARAEIALALVGSDVKVYALDINGNRRREVAAEQDGRGVLRFTADIAADPDDATYLYEIVQKLPGSVMMVQ